jgi:hypothetical protein
MPPFCRRSNVTDPVTPAHALGLSDHATQHDSSIASCYTHGRRLQCKTRASMLDLVARDHLPRLGPPVPSG